MQSPAEDIRELTLLEQIESDPDVNQSSLAAHLGVAVGTVNWLIKRMVDKGYVKVKRAQRKKLRYIITPAGMALRARLTVEYVERSFQLYRKMRQRVSRLLDELRDQGYDRVRVIAVQQGPDDVLDICRLTCLEQNIHIVEDGDAPLLEVQGMKVHLKLPEKEGEHG